MQTLFLADLHLGEKTPEIGSYFKQFIFYCMENQQQINSIYILGDFFEFWVGDDYQSEITDQIFSALRCLTKNNAIKGYFMHGNRDFLIGKGAKASFEQQTGFSIIGDPYNIELDGEKILLCHGDSLCTDDVQYQQLRQMVRNQQWQNDILSKSIAERIQFALAMRQQSEQNYKQGETEAIADVNQQAVEEIMIKNQCKTLIHGHTHRPDRHQFSLQGEPAQRMVLAAWYKRGSFLKYENNSFSSVEL